MFTPNEDLLRTIRAYWMDSDPIVRQLVESLEGLLDELEAALEDLAKAKAGVDKAAQLLEDHERMDLPVETVLASLYETLEHLDTVRSALTNK